MRHGSAVHLPHSWLEASEATTDSPSVARSLRHLPRLDPASARCSSSHSRSCSVARQSNSLIGETFTDAEGRTRPLRHEDVLVVAPYNQQARCLRAALPPAVRVGTVDKFQGQEAPVVFYSTTSSSGDEVPRGLEFLFSRNRLNVAISRAQCLAVLVGSPRLLDVRTRSVDQMRLVNALCRFVEIAAEQASAIRR
jgi:hypothetical protein